MFCLHRLTKLEERSFAFTNAFTTAGEGSVIKLRDMYRNLQSNTRPAANRAHKRVYKGIDLPIAEHTMVLIDCMYVCVYVHMYGVFICIHIYSTDHPQLKQHTRVTRMCARCAKAKNMCGIKPCVYTHVK